MRRYPNIFIIILDTLRKDYSANIENALRKMGFVQYNQAIAPSPWTIPSHASMFTGLYPAFHGAHETPIKKIPNIKLTKVDNLLTSKLKAVGYNTALLTANFFVHPEFGFGGFDYVYYTHPMTIPSLLSKSEKEILSLIFNTHDNSFEVLKYLLSARRYNLLLKGTAQYFLNKTYPHIVALLSNWPVEKGITQITRILDRYLSERGSLKRYNNFVFINTIEMHEPYLVRDNLKILSEHLKTGTLDQGIATRWRVRYDTQVDYVTKKLISLLNVLKKHDIFDESLIVVTSDHGQLLGEHGKIGHGNFLYDELIRVPLLIKYPSALDSDALHEHDDWRWVSLTSIKSFLLALIKNMSPPEDALFEDVVFSESYGIAGKVIPSNTTELKNIMRLEKYRIAIYYKSFKGIFNVTDWKFERMLSYDPEMGITPEIEDKMRKEVVKFLKRQFLVKGLKKPL